MKGGGRHDHQPPISIGAVTALALATSAAPASARSFDFNPNGSYVPVTATSTRAHSQATTPSRTVSTSPTIVRVSAGNSGFDWVDAGIGAAGGLAISIVGLGGALATSQHRAPRPPNRSRNQLTNTERHAGQHHVETRRRSGRHCQAPKRHRNRPPCGRRTCGRWRRRTVRRPDTGKPDQARVDRGDASIGGVVGIGLSVLSMGGGLVIAQRPHDRTGSRDELTFTTPTRSSLCPIESIRIEPERAQ